MQEKNSCPTQETRPLKLNLGCNVHILDGYVNVDIREYKGVDLVTTVYDLPYENDTVQEIYAGHLLEHLDNPLKFFYECWRVLELGGELTIVLPSVNPLAKGYNSIGVLFGFLLTPSGPNPPFTEALHRTWWTPDLLQRAAHEMGFFFNKYIEENDSRLMAKVAWQFGMTFIKTKCGIPRETLDLAMRYREEIERGER